MWLRLSNGRHELVVNEDHIRRLLAEGAVEIPDPRSQPEEAPLSVEPSQEDESLPTDTDSEEVTQQLSAQKKPSRRVSKPSK